MGYLVDQMVDAPAIAAERDRYKATLERIAKQGTGHYVYHGPTGSRLAADHDETIPWVHWATLAEEALSGALRQSQGSE